jgi:molybdopterin synthase sulfur carrier subunit
MIQVLLPTHLQRLANASRVVELQIDGAITQRSILDALEACYPALRGTIRDQATQERRDFIRFFACGEDLSHEPPDALLPEAIASGSQRFMIVGAMAGG